MEKHFIKTCSILLVIVLLANMLPMSIFAEEFQESITSTKTTTEDSVAEEVVLEDVHVITEITENRTEFSKEFLLSNGLHMATVYADPVHYETASGWEEINNTLKVNADGTYSNTAGVWDVTFPDQLDENAHISIEKDGYTLSFFMSGALTSEGTAIMSAGLSDTPLQAFGVADAQTATGQIQQVDISTMVEAAEHPETVPGKLQSRIAYTDVYENTNIVYDLDSNKVKESMILEHYDPNLRGYRYTLSVGAMIPVLEDDGSVTLYDENQKNVVMVMPAPFLIDDNNEYNYDIEVQLAGKGSTYTLVYLLPQSWLAAEDRAWPVVLDPIITPELSVSNIRDCTVAENETYPYTWEYNLCGYDTDIGLAYFYLKYRNLPCITSSDVIVDAYISMFSTEDSTGKQLPVEVHKVNGTWNSEEIAWSANNPGFNPKVEDYVIVDDSARCDWVVTDIVRDWYANENTGMMFKLASAYEGTKNYKQFYSSDNNPKPTLAIYFCNNNGLESSWDYTASSAGRAGTGYINNFTGNLTWMRDDIGFGGNRMPVTIRHIYNLNDATTINDTTNANDSSGNYFGMGAGWRTNFNQLVYHWNLSNDALNLEYYIWEDDDGTDHYFKLEDGVYQDESNSELTLTINASGSEKYCITDKSGYCRYFDTYGRLTRLTNNQKETSSITITYKGTSDKRISTIRDGISRLYQFFYDDNGMLHYIAYRGTVGTTNLHITTFTYEGNLLETVTDNDGKTSQYTYSGSCLASAADVDGYTLTYSYNTITTGNSWQPYRVQSVEESENNGNTEGGKLTFAYAHNQTTITDYNGNVEIYQFNDYGNTISIQDDEGHAQFAQFARMDKDDTAGKANQLTLASKLQNTVSNRYKDGGFEYQTAWTPHGSGVSASASGEAAFRGDYGQKIVNTAYSKNSTAYSPNFYVGAKETITVSAYIKNPDAATTLELHYYDSNTGTYPYVSSSEVPASGDWTRAEVTFTNPLNAALYVYIHLRVENPGTYYVDCVQAESEASASRYNLVENGDFRNGTYAWTDGSGSVASDTAACAVLDANMYKITGSSTAKKTVTQRIDITGFWGDSFVLAAWAKADSAPISGDREFGIWVRFDGDRNADDKYFMAFNPDVDGWQYAAKAFVAPPVVYDHIILEITYSYNVNVACFDGIQLYKENFGTSYTYDEDGNVKSIIDLQKQTTTYEYDTNSNLTQIIQDGSAKMTYEYDYYHNVETATTDEGLKYAFEYDDYGNNIRVSTTTAGKTMQSTAVYTSDGNRLVSTTDALGKTTSYSYNENTNALEWVQYPEDTEATRTTYTYDNMCRMASAACTTDTGLSLNAAYTYEDDLLTKITTPSTTYNFTYGDFDLRTGVSIGNRTLATYHYTEETVNDRKFDLDRLDYGNGDKVEYTYDDEDRLIRQTYEDGTYVTYAYDNDGQLAKVYDSQSGITTSYTYDLTGRLVKYTEHGNGHDYSVAYTFNDKNQLSTVMEIVDGHDRESTYEYDDDGRITFFEKVLARRRYAYDAFGRVSSTETLGSDYAEIFKTTYTYNDTASSVSGQVSSLTHDGPQYDKTYSYTYDDNGNILSVSDGTNTTSYVYDSANQLIRENNQAGNFTHTWTYDNAGNIQERKEYAYTTGSLESATPNDTVAYTYGDEDWGDLLTAYDGQAITYDEIGNPLTDGTWTYTWQHGRQLASMTKGATTWNYTYNADGLRTNRTDGTDNYRYVYDGGQLTFMARNGLYLRFAYTPEGTPLSILYKGTTYYYVTNLQGDVTAILSQNGYVMVEYTYDAWGNLLSTTGPLANSLGLYNPLRYRGYIYDYETGLYYLQSRYYNPEMGRFINADNQISNVGGNLLGYNQFAYCFNNPVHMSDNSGNWPKLSTIFKTMAVGALAVAATALVVAAVAVAAPAFVAIGGTVLNTAAIATAATVVGTQALAVTAVTATASVVSSEIEKKNKQSYSVYFLEDQEGTIQYVGRVTDSGYDSRMNYHRATKDLTPAHRISNLSYAEARGLEEIGMIECHTLNASNPINNQIHGISDRNPNGGRYMDAACNYLLNRAEDWVLNLFE